MQDFCLSAFVFAGLLMHLTADILAYAQYLKLSFLCVGRQFSQDTHQYKIHNVHAKNNDKIPKSTQAEEF